MRTFFLIFTCVVIVSLLGACNIPDITSSMETVEPVESTPAYETVKCAFMWANDQLPELSADLNQALQTALPDSEGYAQAYGENCVTEGGQVVRFHAMETDFYITLKVEDLGDLQVLGELVEEVMDVLSGFPTEETPGPQPGYIGITFESPEDSIRLWDMRTNVEAALESGMRGEDLFNALQSK